MQQATARSTDPRASTVVNPTARGKTLVRVYEFGCGHNAICGLDAAIEQMFRRNQLWNRIVEIDNDIRTKVDSSLFAGAPEDELELLRHRLAECRRHLATLRADPTSPRIERAQAREEARVAAAAVQASLDVVKSARKAKAEANRVLMRELNSERVRRIRQAQMDSGLYWCNRTEVFRNYEVARVRAMKTGTRLQERPWRGTGAVCVCFQKGLAASKVFGGNGRLQIDPVSEAAWNSPLRAVRRRLAQTCMRIRVSANPDLSPVWLEFPIIMHRPLPKEGVIRSASIIREKVGVSFRHRLLLTVKEPASPMMEQRAEAVGIDAGWRVTPEGLRVAYWCGTDGSGGSLILPNSDLAAFKRIDSLQVAIRSAHDQVRSFLDVYSRSRPMPELLAAHVEAAVSSHSPQALLELFGEWKTHRFSGDANGFKVVADWKKQHVHLWTWQVNLRDQLIRRRRELYRCFAAKLARRFRNAFLNDIALRRIAARPIAGIQSVPAQRHYRFIAAVSTLFRILQEAFEKLGGSAVRIKIENATMACHSCGALDDWSPASTLMHRCSNCGLEWDQDFNAAMNLLRYGLPGGDNAPKRNSP